MLPRIVLPGIVLAVLLFAGLPAIAAPASAAQAPESPEADGDEGTARDDLSWRLTHLPLGDPERRERTVPVPLDAVVDTRDGAVLTPTELAERLAEARLVLVGETHTRLEDHRVQRLVIEALHDAGREVVIGLEMFPATVNRPTTGPSPSPSLSSSPSLSPSPLAAWSRGALGEEEFVEASGWWEHWGYPWSLYREIFLAARDRGIPLAGVNVPRSIVSAVGRRGVAALDELPAADRALLPESFDAFDPQHRTLFQSYFAEDDAIHSAMSEEQWDRMVAAQATWDAAMAHHAARVLADATAASHDSPPPVMVLLVGSGHVGYGVGIARHARRWIDGPVVTLIPVAARGTGVRDDAGRDPGLATVQASYADFVWGVAPEPWPAVPSLGLATTDPEPEGDGAQIDPGTGTAQAATAPLGRRVLAVTAGSPAERAGVIVGDRVVAVDGVPVTDGASLRRATADLAWGERVVIEVVRTPGDSETDAPERLTLPVVLRRGGD